MKVVPYSKKTVCSLIIFLCLAYTNCYASDKGTLNIGGHYNGLFNNYDTNGLGASVGFEYRPTILKNLSLSLRYKYVYLHSDDGSKIIIGDDGTINPYNKNPRLSYNLNTQQIGIVPRFYYELMDGFKLFIENEFNYAVVIGDVKYLWDMNEKRKVKTYIPFVYSGSVGFELEKEHFNYGFSFGYTTLNFNKVVSRRKPPSYNVTLPDLWTGVIMNFYLKYPLFK